MEKKDREEGLIYSRLAEIEVDGSRIKPRVMEKLGAKKVRKKPFLRSGLAVALSLVLVVGASAAGLRNSEWFMDKFQPLFRDLVDPIDLYAEDQGIKLGLIAGQKYDNNALVYLSIQDTSGKDRITEKTEFRDGLFLGMDSSGNSYGFGINDRLISFNEETNTGYYELNISTNKENPLSETLRLGTSRIYFDSIRYEDELMEIAREDLENPRMFYLEESKIWGGRDLGDKGEDILEIGRYGDLPHGHRDQWISNLGLIDGRLHIQVGSRFKKDFGPSGAYFSLENGEGEPRAYEASRVFLANEKGRILDIYKEDLDQAEYRYEEFIFPLVGEREVYRLYYTGSLWEGLEGHWELETDLGGDRENIRTIDREFDLGDYGFESLSLTPLGLRLSGSYRGKKFEPDFKIGLDSQKGWIELESIGGSLNGSSFELEYGAKEPLDLEGLEALIIGDFRLDIGDK